MIAFANPLRALLARRRRKRQVRVYYDEAYRLPLTGAESGPGGIETRRADDAVHYLLSVHAVKVAEVVTPEAASYTELERVHPAAYLESLHDARALASIFAVDPSDVVVDALLRSLRLACGGTIAGARYSLATRNPALNLMGGFHHAAPDRGAGFCALNDVAIAIAALRSDGFEGKVAVLDFDCHPPDGTAACLGQDKRVWLASISGTSWGPLEGVDETVLPTGSGDADYLAAVARLLARLPEVQFVFVIAGGDVLSGDRLGTLGLSLSGVRSRDLRVAHRIDGLPQVWLPAGGYSAHAWKIVAGTGLALAFDSDEAIPQGYDPLVARLSGIARSLKTEALGSSPLLSEADVAEALGMAPTGPRKLLGFYTAEGLEYALERYRALPLLRRLGFGELHVIIDRAGACDRARLFGRDSSSGKEVVLIELEVERRRIGGGTFLFINWLSLRNPRAKFSALRPQLPGQEVPGLGLAREMAQLMAIMAKRLALDGVAFHPSWYHMAYAARHGGRFVDPVRQGRFEALVRDLQSLPLLDATRAIAEGRVRLNGEHYQWEAVDMVQWLHQPDDPHDREAIAAERERCHFTAVVGAPPNPDPRLSVGR